MHQNYYNKLKQNWKSLGGKLRYGTFTADDIS